ncbi:MAG: hypothetical protein PHS41_12055 [Victivallaceae bacterium]|nr:hypothetical protein [Victivallaceae bacterium]
MQFTLNICLLLAAALPVMAETMLEWDNQNVWRSNRRGITVTAEGDSSLIAEFRTSEPWPHLVLRPKNAKSWDVSSFDQIAFDVENLSTENQCEIEFNGGMWNRGYLGTAILRPGEKRTFRYSLHHQGKNAFDPLFRARFMPDGFRGGKNLDTAKLPSLQLISSFPISCKYRLSGIRLSGKRSQDPEAKTFFPLIDRYGQNRHATWPNKICSDADLKMVLE